MSNKFVECLSENGFLPENIEIDEYIKSTPGLQEVYPVLCRFNTESGSELTNIIASFLVIGYKIGLGTVNVEETTLTDEINMYKERFEEIFTLIESKDLESANQLVEELLIDLDETPVGVIYDLIEELQDKLDELNEQDSPEDLDEDTNICDDPNCCECNTLKDNPVIDVNTPISVMFSTGEPFTFTPQDVIDYVAETTDSRWK